MSERFKGRNVFVSGSSRGIGLKVAEAFGLLGANVVINCSKSDTELSAAERELKSRGISVHAVMGDVSDYEVCRRVVSEAASVFGDIDILVNNAGVAHFGLFTDMSPAEMREVTEKNVYSVYNCCHLVLPAMIRARSGRIVNISSVWGVSGASCEVAYSAAKGAVNTFTRALSKEVAPSGVLVNAIACGVIDTQMNERLSKDEKTTLIDSISVGRFGTVNDVAELCVYLAGSEYMTGQVLTLDGGFI